MRKIPLHLAIPLAAVMLTIVLFPIQASAWWPTTVEENLAVSVDPDTISLECSAMPFLDGATLVVFRKQWYGNQYQIIDKYGQLKYAVPHYFTPSVPNFNEEKAHLISDANNGAFITWLRYGTGILAQRLDSLGNILWGDSGKVISPFEEQDFDISDDGQGGFFLAVSPNESDWTDLYVQRIDGNGNILWGPQGTAVSTIPNSEARYPHITHGSQGDAYVAWQGSYGAYGTIFMNRINSSGVKAWYNDLQIGGDDKCKLIPDGQGGAIVQYEYGDQNAYKRIGAGGNVIWTKTGLSWYYWAVMIEGEPGYFYLQFDYQSGTNAGEYSQKVRISDGHSMWSGSPGKQIAYHPGWGYAGGLSAYYRYPYYYAEFGFATPGEQSKNQYCQVLDSLGNCLLGLNGVLMTSIDQNSYYQYSNIVPTSDEGMVIVWQKDYEYDVWAKRANMDGTLGGPLPPVEDVVISISGNDVVLNWSAVPGASSYHIYYSMNPYEFGVLPYATVTGTSFTDVNAVPAGHAFYRVTWEN